MADILEKITRQTREDLARRKREVTFRDLESFAGYEKTRLDFGGALRKSNTVSVIAEIKKASPSKGVIREDFDPTDIAEQYIENGAAALSVLTDTPFFQGSLDYLNQVSKISSLPVLRKDFVVEPYQVKEARAFGADAVLLIVSMYEGSQLPELLAAAKEFGLQALVECYHEEELEGIDWDEVHIAGVNNRNLATFEVDLHRGTEMLKTVPDHVVKVSESGISRPDDLMVLYKNGIHAALIGEHFMRQPDIGTAVRHFMDEFEEKARKEIPL